MRRTPILAVLITASLLIGGCTRQEAADNDVILSDPSVSLDENQALDSTIEASIPPEPTKLESLMDDTTPEANTPQLDSSQPRTPDQFRALEASSATIQTNKGAITVELYQDKTPITVTNFLNLIDQSFYDGIVFHRVIDGFMAQVGDPLTKDPSQQARWGQGGPGYTIPDEFDPSLRHDAPGILSMANAGPGTGGSQFFLTFEPTPWLDDKHTVFGKVTEGMDVLMSIEQGDTIETITFE